MYLFSIKNNLNYEMNIYKLIQYNYNNNNTILEIFDLSKKNLKNLKNLKEKIYLGILSFSNFYALNLNKNKISNSIYNENCINTFNEISSNLLEEVSFKPEETSKIKEWLYHMYERGKVKAPDIPDNGMIGKPINDFIENINFEKLNKFCDNFNYAAESVGKFFQDIKWIFQNPLRSILIVDNLIFQYAAIALLVIIIVSLFAKMFTGENELKKPIKILKSTVLLSFITNIVLQCFLTVGYH